MRSTILSVNAGNHPAIFRDALLTHFLQGFWNVLFMSAIVCLTYVWFVRERRSREDPTQIEEALLAICFRHKLYRRALNKNPTKRALWGNVISFSLWWIYTFGGFRSTLLLALPCMDRSNVLTVSWFSDVCAGRDRLADLHASL